MRRDPSEYFRFAPSQAASARQLIATFELPSEFPDSVVLIEEGRVFRYSDAVIRIAQRFPGWWRLVTLAHVVPRWLRDGAYRLIARNRYRLFGSRTSCALPTPGTLHRFLN
jgi:predicted DCC family thiol-disulfide oxidoreductase YuxK